MWRYYKSVDNPKTKQTPEDKKQKDKQYEAKRRKRSFLDEWKQDRPWLRFDSDSQAMFCEYCINTGVEPEKSNFVKGCTNIRFETIRHQLSQFHLTSTNKFFHDQNPKDAPAVRAHLSLNKNVSQCKGSSFVRLHVHH